MPFRATHSVFALTVRLILRRALNIRAARHGVRMMRIHVIDMHDEAARLHRHLSRRSQVMILSFAMQPDRQIARMHFTVHDIARRRLFDAARGEAEHTHEEIVLGGDVRASEDRCSP